MTPLHVTVQGVDDDAHLQIGQALIDGIWFFTFLFNFILFIFYI